MKRIAIFLIFLFLSSAALSSANNFILTQKTIPNIPGQLESFKVLHTKPEIPKDSDKQNDKQTKEESFILIEIDYHNFMDKSAVVLYCDIKASEKGKEAVSQKLKLAYKVRPNKTKTLQETIPYQEGFPKEALWSITITKIDFEDGSFWQNPFINQETEQSRALSKRLVFNTEKITTLN